MNSYYLRFLIAIVISLVPSHFFIPCKAQRNCECTNIEQRQACKSSNTKGLQDSKHKA